MKKITRKKVEKATEQVALRKSTKKKIVELKIIPRETLDSVLQRILNREENPI